ncbi:hypothetical protein GGX14DRAFT_595242 [Mycena pura]|uniref:Transmembrane protein n=1 Tax=Mycena pura TaxID=153505 RepID=A0AAD6YGF8_9AGAR|nr:hypothetical protein GGX14DRAFT_595242 [Mycena pura]
MSCQHAASKIVGSMDWSQARMLAYTTVHWQSPFQQIIEAAYAAHGVESTALAGQARQPDLPSHTILHNVSSAANRALVMRQCSISAVIVSLLGFLCGSFAQTVGPVTAVTLWQFGQGRLLEGRLGTAPLIPLGTALGGVATTYLYQAVNPVVTTATNEEGLLTPETIASATPRTVIVSASGWIEAFGTGVNIECSLVNSAFGDCVTGTNAVTANSGVPTAEVLQVALTVPPIPTSSGVSGVFPINLLVPTLLQAVLAGTPTPTSSAQLNPSALSSTPTPTPKPSTVRTGPIVGGVVGGVVALGVIIALSIVLWRRRRLRLLKVEDGITPRAFTIDGASVPRSDDAAAYSRGIDTREHIASQPLFATPLRGKRDTRPSRTSLDARASSSAPTEHKSYRDTSDALAAGEPRPIEDCSSLTTSELARMLYERVHTGNHSNQAAEDTPPPSYLGSPDHV